MYLSSKRLFQRFPYPLPADVVCMRLSSMNIPSICTIFPRFALIFQCIMQHHCTVLSVQNRFFLAMLRQYGLLSRHLSVPPLQQNPQHYTPSLRQALRSNPSPSLPDIFRYIHPESVIYAGLPYQPLPEQHPQHKPYDAETAVWQSIIPHIQFQLQQSYTSYP